MVCSTAMAVVADLAHGQATRADSRFTEMAHQHGNVVARFPPARYPHRHTFRR